MVPQKFCRKFDDDEFLSQGSYLVVQEPDPDLERLCKPLRCVDSPLRCNVTSVDSALRCNVTSVDSGEELGLGKLTLSSGTGTFELQLSTTCECGFVSTFSAKEATHCTILCESDRFRRLELQSEDENFVVQVQQCFQEWMEKQCLRAAQALRSEFPATLHLDSRHLPVMVTWAETGVVLCCKKDVYNKDHLQNVISDLGLDVAQDRVLVWKNMMDEPCEANRSSTAWELQYSVRVRNHKLGSAQNVDSQWYVMLIGSELAGHQLEVNAGATGLSELLARSLESLGQGKLELEDILEQALKGSFLDRHFLFLSSGMKVRTAAHPGEPSWVNATTLIYRKPLPILPAVPSANDQILNFPGEAREEIEQKIEESEFLHIRRSDRLGDYLDFNGSDAFWVGRFQGMMAQSIGEGQALLCVCYDGSFDPKVAEKKGKFLSEAVWRKINRITAATGTSEASLVGLSDGCVQIILLCTVAAVASLAAGAMADRALATATVTTGGVSVGAEGLLFVGTAVGGAVGAGAAAAATIGATAGAAAVGVGAAGAWCSLVGLGYYMSPHFEYLCDRFLGGRQATNPPAPVDRQDILNAMHMQQAMGEVRRYIPHTGPEVQQAVIFVPHAVQNFAARNDDEGPNALALIQPNGGNAQEGQLAPLAHPSYQDLRRIIPRIEAWLQQNSGCPHFAVIRAYAKLSTCGLLLLSNSDTIYHLAQQHGEKFSQLPVVSSRRKEVRHLMMTLGRLLHEDIGFPICTHRETLARGQNQLTQLKRFKVNRTEIPLDIELRLSRLGQRVSEAPGSAQSVEMIETILTYLQGAQAAFETLIPQSDHGTLTERLISEAARGVANQAGRELATWIVGGLLMRRTG